MREDDKHNLMWMAGLIIIVVTSTALMGLIIIGGQYAVKRLDLDKKTQCTP